MRKRGLKGLIVCLSLLFFTAVAWTAQVPDTAPTTIYPVHADASSPIALIGSDLNSADRQVTPANEVVPLGGSGAAGNMLQFKAGGHVLGFQPNKAYLAGLDHALSIEFLGTPGVMPTAASTESASGNMIKAPAMSTVRYQNLWNGISLTYESTKDGITESTYHVAPGGDVSKIRLRYNVPVESQKDGSLKFKFDTGYLIESSPVAWQEIGGKHMPVVVAFRVSGGEVGFSVGQYDRSYPLIIDPTYVWHTFYGSSGSGAIGSAKGSSIAVDGSGNVYITGDSDKTWGEPLNTFTAGAPNVFVLKITSGGTFLWNTFYGSGSGTGDVGNGIAVDSENVYVTGSSNATWGEPRASSTFTNGASNAFVLKLNISGMYQWHTFHGKGSGNGIAVDGSGNVYVTGYSLASWGSSPINSFTIGNQNVFVLKLGSEGTLAWNTFYGCGFMCTGSAGNSIAFDGDANVYITGYSSGTWGSPIHAFTATSQNVFVLKLNRSTGAYQWHTFYGCGMCVTGSVGNSIAAAGVNVYVTGYSSGTWGDDPKHEFTGEFNKNVFVLKLDNEGTLVWNTFYGSGADGGHVVGNGIALDEYANVYVTGSSVATWGSPINPFSGAKNVFVLKLDSDGTFVWNTFCPPSPADGYDRSGIAIGLDDFIYVAGNSVSNWGLPINNFSIGSTNVLVLQLNSSGLYQWHTFYGSSIGRDIGNGIAVDSSGNVYVTGYSYETWGSPLHPFAGGAKNVFVLKIDSSGTLKWNTFYGAGGNGGGSGGDAGSGIAVDGSDNVYVTGVSAAAWGFPLNAFTDTYWNVFVLKINSSGARQWHTFYGPGSESYGIAVDSSGNVYVTGVSMVTWESPLHVPPLNPFTDDIWNVFVLKLNSSGGYQWHTFYESSSGFGIAVDGDGNNIYVTGGGYATWGSPVNQYAGADFVSNIFVMKLNSDGGYQWHTFHGSGIGDGDSGWSIAVDGHSTGVYVTGLSSGTWGESPVNGFIGSDANGFVLKLNSNGDYIWNTFSEHLLHCVAVDGNSNIYASGAGTSVLKLDSSNGISQYTVFSDVSSSAYGIAVDGGDTGSIYVTGPASTTWGPPLHAYSGGVDIFVLKIQNGISLTGSGWNLISLPRQPSDTDISNVLGNISGKYASAWAFQNGSWKVYDPATPGLSDLSAMEAGYGYWLDVTEAATISVTGTEPSGAINLIEGWNLVGYNSSTFSNITDAMTSIADNVVSVLAYKDGAWQTYNPSDLPGSTLTTMIPGYGYWINTNAPCEWIWPPAPN